MIVVGGNLASAQEADLTLDFTSAWESNGTNSFQTTIGGAEYVISGSGTNFKFNTGYFMLGKNGAYIDLPKVNFDVEKIVVVGRSGASASVKMNLFVDDVAVSTETTGSTGTNEYEIAEGYQAANTQYTLQVTSDHNAQITHIKYYKKSSGPVSVTGISLDATEAKLMVGKARSLTATIVPANATNKTVNWTSSDETVATVTDGVVTAVAEGVATITATSAENSNINATCEVTVIGELNETTATGNLNNSATGVFAGQQGFTTGANSVSGTLVTDAGDVTVDYAGTSSSYLNNEHIRMYKSGSTLKFTAPEGYDLTKIIFTITDGNSSNLEPDKGSYSDGTWTGTESEVTFKGKNATIRISAAEVTLKKATEKAELVSIAVDSPKTEFSVGDDFEFGGTVTATYANETTKDVTAQAEFTGYDKSQSGEQTVTVSYTEDEVTKTTTYDITVNAVAMTGISLDIIEATLAVGQTKKINATIIPDNATNKDLVWTSEDESVATVDQNGEVTAVGVGTIIIKAAAADNNDIFGACTINVVELKTEPYSLVTNVSDLAEGDEVIIVSTVSTDKGKAMSTTQNNNNRGAADVTFEEGKALVPNISEIQVFTLEGNTEGWYFYTGSGYIYAASKSSNHLKTQTTKNDNAKAVININGEGTSVVFQREGCNVLQYNSGSDIFSCYASASQSPVQIYKKGATSATTYSLVVGEEETPFESLSLTKELPAHTQFYIKDNMGNEYHSADAQSELIIIAENHENLPTSADGKDFYLKKANTWVFTLTEASDGLMLTVSPETEGETKYMLSGYLQESNDVFDENLKLTKEMTSTTEEFYFTRSDDYGLTNLTPTTFNAPEDRRYWIFSEDDPTVEFIAGEIRGSYTVGEAGTYTFTIDLTNNTVTAEKTVEYVDLTISSAEWATYVTPVAVLFPDDVKAYIVTEINPTTNVAEGQEITEAPEGTPVIVNGTAGVHKLPKVESAVLDYINQLKVSDGTVTGDGTIYVLAVQGGQAGFAPLKEGKTLSEGKAYLQAVNAGAKINFVIDGEATDIRNIENAVDFSDGDWYNLQGVKVTNPQRGIYIHNGKKVVIK